MSKAPAAATRLPLDAIDAEHWPNPRGPVDVDGQDFAELLGSLEEVGQLQPVVVGPALLEGGRHPIIAGWRRYTAATVLGWAEVDVKIRADVTDRREALRAALAENMAREDMSPLAEAEAIATLMELGDTQEEAAKAVGVSVRTARNRLAILKAPPAVREAFIDDTISQGAIPNLLKIADKAPALAERLVAAARDGEMARGDLERPEELQMWASDLAGTWLDEPPVALHLANHGYGYGVLIDGLPGLTAEQRDQLAARRKAIKYPANWPGRPGDIRIEHDWAATLAGDALLDIESTGLNDRVTHDHYVADPAAIWAIACEALDRMDKEAAKARKEASQAANRKAAGDQGPSADELAAKEARARRDTEIAVHALQGNVEQGALLASKLRKVKLAGDVAALLCRMAMAHVWWDGLVNRGLGLMDPDFRHEHGDFIGGGGQATASAAAERAGELLEQAATPEHEAAIIVRAVAAYALVDDRVLREQARGGTNYLDDETAAIGVKIARDAGALTDRTERLLDAQLVHAAALEEYRNVRPARRALLELSDAEGQLEIAELRKRMEPYRYDAHEHGADQQPYGLAIGNGIVYAHEAGWLQLTDEHAALTDAGRTTLEGALHEAPRIRDIDPPGMPGDQAPEAIAPEPEPEPEDQAPAAEDDDQEADVVALEEKDRSTREQALDLIAAEPGITVPAMAGRLEIPQNRLYRLLPALAGEGIIAKEGRGWWPTQDRTLDAQEANA